MNTTITSTAKPCTISGVSRLWAGWVAGYPEAAKLPEDAIEGRAGIFFAGGPKGLRQACLVQSRREGWTTDAASESRASLLAMPSRKEENDEVVNGWVAGLADWDGA